MLRKLATLALLLAVACHASPREPEDRRPVGAVITGVGQFSCGHYLADKASHTQAEMSPYLQWIDGFMVGYNFRSNFGKTWKSQASGNLTSLPDEPTVYLYVETHCRTHPLDTVLDATFALIEDMGGEVVWKPRK